MYTRHDSTREQNGFGKYDINLAPAVRSGWRRVNKVNPCPVCDAVKWCSVSSDGAVAICMHKQAGSLKKIPDNGYLHRLNDQSWQRSSLRLIELHPRGPRRNDLPLLLAKYRTAIDPRRLERLARQLGLSLASLNRLGIGWDCECRAWAFPMTDVHGSLLGIRLRTDIGRKFAVTGGREGLFIPSGLDKPETLFIPEGLTDTATLLDWGLPAVGRPSCAGGVGLLAELVNQWRPSRTVIVADSDPVGQQGARTLASTLALYCCHVCIIAPPPDVKDVRAWKFTGTTASQLQALVDAAPLWKLAIALRYARRRR